MEREQLGSTAQRGELRTLTMTCLNSSKTALRAPDPGAMHLAEWAPLPEQNLKAKRVIPQMDGAWAHRLKVRGMTHNRVGARKRNLRAKDNSWRTGGIPRARIRVLRRRSRTFCLAAARSLSAEESRSLIVLVGICGRISRTGAKLRVPARCAQGSVQHSGSTRKRAKSYGRPQGGCFSG